MISEKVFPVVSIRDPRTRAGWFSDQVVHPDRTAPCQKKMEFKDRTRTRKFLKFQDRTAPGPKKPEKSRTTSHRAVRGPGGAWIPVPVVHQVVDTFSDFFGPGAVRSDFLKKFSVLRFQKFSGPGAVRSLNFRIFLVWRGAVRRF